MPSPSHVVLLRDGSWPQVPGVCCWRSRVSSAFAGAGAVVTEITCAPGGPWNAAVSGVPGLKSRLRWVPPSAVRVLGGLRRRWKRAAASSRQAVRQRRQRARLSPRLAGAALVIAESPAIARLAVDCGVEGRRLWVLALPMERMFPDEDGGYAAELALVAPAVGGFLTHREAGRDSVERATSRTRTRVELFPLLSAALPCPDCAAVVAEPPPAGAPAPVAYLARLRAVGHTEPVPAPRQPTGAGWDAPPPRKQFARFPAPEPDAQAGSPGLSVAALLDAAVPEPLERPRARRSVLVSGYDLKFAADLAQRLDRRSDLSVTTDAWPDLNRPSNRTRTGLRDADSVFAEWARTSAIWLSQRKRPGQFLVVRLHRFELDSPYPRDIVMDNVDSVVYIAPLFGRRIRDELGWPVEKLVYVPNFLDVEWLDRPKLPDARFTLGFVGMEWSRKRFDLALDLLSALRQRDQRFRLLVRSVMPWHNQYVWAQPAERTYASWCFDRIEQDPLLRDAIQFEAPGLDMARWYRWVGQLLSTSDYEGSHASVAEAMASGAVPVIRPWLGATEVYDKEWVHGSLETAVTAVLERAEPDRWAEQAARARTEIRHTHDPAAVVSAWADLMQGDLPAARSHFADLSGLDRGLTGPSDEWNTLVADRRDAHT